MKTALLFGVHAHQPAGNFPEVLEQAHALSYRPFLETLYRFPDFRFAAHFSGPLLDYLLERYPRDMLLLREMVARGQVELFGGGDTEPVLAAIPHRDRVAQLAALAEKVERVLGAGPTGAWLTERVWESVVVPALVESGIRYVTVDDYHFLCAGKHLAELDGYFTTEEGGARIDLYPISEALRYRIPFAPAADAVAFIAEQRGATVYFDDIEKFGIWPETHEWVYGKGWLEQFVRGVLASDRIETLTFREHRARAASRGIVYLPTTSYIEMNEWTLPAAAAHAYSALVAREKEADRYEAEKPFLRGGIWRNFMSRYPETNWMHKRMLQLSERLAGLPRGTPTDALRRLLHLGQANDAYWHGLFGGLYLPHLRRAVYGALVELEARLDAIAPRPARVRADLDGDGVDELFIQNGELQAVVKLDGSASLIELDAYALAQNFGDTLRRHAEHYHRTALDAQRSAARRARDRLGARPGAVQASRRGRGPRARGPRPNDLPRLVDGRRGKRAAARRLRARTLRFARTRGELHWHVRRRARREARPRPGQPGDGHLVHRGRIGRNVPHRAEPRAAELRRPRRPLRRGGDDPGRLRSARRRRSGDRAGPRRPVHGRRGRAAVQLAGGRARAAAPHGVAVGGRLREDHAVRDRDARPGRLPRGGTSCRWR